MPSKIAAATQIAAAFTTMVAIRRPSTDDETYTSPAASCSTSGSWRGGVAVQAKWQAARCAASSGVPPRFGSCSEQTSCAIGQRGWNRQPDGGEIGLPGSPAHATASEVRPGTSRGTAFIRPWVYGCLGLVNSSAVGAVSTILPRYMTET